MPIVYSVIARGKVVLAEYSAQTGNFPTVTRVLLEKIEPKDYKMSYTYDQYIFNFEVDDNITYLCLTDQDESRKRRVAFQFLAEMKQAFRRQFGQRPHTAIAFSLNSEFQSTMADLIQRFNSGEGDAFSRVQGKLDNVKDVMMQNIDKVLDRGERVELLVEKTDELSRSAQKFQYSSRNLKNAMWCRNVKMWLLIIGIVLVIIYFIVSFICGFNFKKCRK